MRRTLPVTLIVLASLAVGACSSGATPSPSATPAPSAAPSVAAPSAAASPSAPASVAPSATANACPKESLTLVTPGKLTVGTDNPAYPPYFSIPAGKATAPWELGDPTNDQGFESAFAYALAARLGFANADVKWIVVPFDNSFAPGPKKFDIDVNQVSFKPERAQSVDLSDGYYNLNQSVVALKANPLAQVTSIAALKTFRFGAQVGTTSLDTITNVITPSVAAKVYTTNDDAIAGLKAKQIDGLVVDLPTAFFVTQAQVDNSAIVGQFGTPTGADAEHFSVVLAKGSPLTPCVNATINAMKGEGTLDYLTKVWLSDKASAPVFQP